MIILDKLIGKIPKEYHEKTRNGLLAGMVFFSSFGLLEIMESTEKTREESWLFFQKVIDIPLYERIGWLIAGIFSIFFAILCLLIAWKLIMMTSKFKKYSVIVSSSNEVSLENLSDITRKSKNTVISDIQLLIDTGYFENCYIDYKKQSIINKDISAQKSKTQLIQCQCCGAKNELNEEQTNSCEYCGTVL